MQTFKIVLFVNPRIFLANKTTKRAEIIQMDSSGSYKHSQSLEKECFR